MDLSKDPLNLPSKRVNAFILEGESPFGLFSLKKDSSQE
jgi:hypothetical protein